MSAYLNAPINKDIYVTQPDGYKSIQRENINLVIPCRQYGLKQSGQNWHGALTDFLKHK